MKRVLVIANNLNQASYRLRIEALIEPLRQRGVELYVQVRPRAWRARRKLMWSADQFDATILQRKLLDPGDARVLAHRANRLFFDVDDAVMFSNGPAGLWARWRNWRRFAATSKHVDHVVAGNRNLAHAFRHRGAKMVSVLPTMVDVDRYEIKMHAPAEQVTLVWIGSRSTMPYVRQFLPALEDAAKQARGFELKLIIIADESLTSSLLEIEHIPWSEATEAAALARGDIGIAPTPCNRWTQGKCGFKIVQYMAAGLPVIASPVGANAELVADGLTGLLPESPADWPQAILTLAEDWRLRARMGSTGRATAVDDYNLPRAADFWARLLAEA